jgi:putative ABC transport system permease protein
MQTVLNSDVAAKYPLHVGDKIIGAHGLSNSDDLHSDFPYTITGILKPTGTVLDRLVLTPVESVWHVHEHPDADDPEEVAYKKAHPEKEITALLITYKSPMAAVLMPRLVNKSSAMQAAAPAFELARLMKMLGFGSDAIAVFGGVLMAIAALGFFITLLNAARERRYDIALMRSLGATRGKVFGFVLAEGLVLGIGGVLLGVLLGHIFTAALAQWIADTRHLQLQLAGIQPFEFTVMLIALGLALVATMIPAIMAYRVNVAALLSKGS